jgi:hypothetical protein
MGDIPATQGTTDPRYARVKQFFGKPFDPKSGFVVPGDVMPGVSTTVGAIGVLFLV